MVATDFFAQNARKSPYIRALFCSIGDTALLQGVKDDSYRAKSMSGRMHRNRGDAVRAAEKNASGENKVREEN